MQTISKYLKSRCCRWCLSEIGILSALCNNFSFLSVSNVSLLTSRKCQMILLMLIPFLLGALSHTTCLFADFTYDDNPAVLEHPVSRLAQPLRRALFTDYWGLDITSFHSHGSFRPVTTASFALSSLLSRSFAHKQKNTSDLSSQEHTGEAFEYRLVSLLLHASSSSLSFLLYQRFSGSSFASLISASLFAVHPILTEAVCSIACRADLLAGFFSLLVVYTMDAFLHADEVKLQKICCATFAMRSVLLLSSLVFGILATFSKETGVMSLLVATGFCAAVAISHLTWGGKTTPEWTGARYEVVIRACFGMFFSFSTAVLLFMLRLSIQGDRLPQFYVVDNTLVGLTGLPWLLTVIYLAARHLGLLFFPYPQSHDWSFLVIDPVLDVGDIRNTLSVTVMGLFMLVTMSSLLFFLQKVAGTDTLRLRLIQCATRRSVSPASSPSSPSSSSSSSSRGLILLSLQPPPPPLPISMSMCFSIGAMFVSFLPASSILFTTGFTIAERVLYVPGVFLGLAISIALSSTRLMSLHPRVTITCAATLCALFLSLSLNRSMVWTNDETLWASALLAAPNHPKALYTLANRLQTQAGTGGKDGYLPVISNVLGPTMSERLFKGLNVSAYSSAKELDYQAALVLYALCIATFRDRTGNGASGLEQVSTHPNLRSWDRIFPDPSVNTVHILMDLLDEPKTREEMALRQNASATVLRQMLHDLHSDDEYDSIPQEDDTELVNNESMETYSSAMNVNQLRLLYINTPPHQRMSALLSMLDSSCSRAPSGSERLLELQNNASTSCVLSRSGMKIDKGFARVHERVLTVGLSALNAAVFTGDVYGWKLGLEHGGKLFYVDNIIAELLLRSSAILSRSNPSLGPTVAMLTLAESYKMRGAFGLSSLWFDRSARWTAIQAEERAKEKVALYREKYDKVKIKASSRGGKAGDPVSAQIQNDERLSRSFQRLTRLADQISANWEWTWSELDNNNLSSSVIEINQTSLLHALATERIRDAYTPTSLEPVVALDADQQLQCLGSFVKIRRILKQTDEVNLSNGGSFCTITSSSSSPSTLRESITAMSLLNKKGNIDIQDDLATHLDNSFTCDTPFSKGEPCGRILSASSRAALAAVTAIKQAVTRGVLQLGEFCSCKNATPDSRTVRICVEAESALPWSRHPLGFPLAVRSHRAVQRFERHACPDACVHWFNEDSIEQEDDANDENGNIFRNGESRLGLRLGLGSFAPIATDAVTFPLALRLARRAAILGASWVVMNGEESQEPYNELLSLCGCD